MTLLYVAGPMTGYENFNHPAFDEATEALRAAGYEVISPAEVDRHLGIDLTKPFTEADYHEAMLRDIPYVLKADGVAMLEGWRASRGARLEHDIAVATGKRAMMVGAWLYEASKKRTRVGRP